VLLYEMLAGAPSFIGESMGEVLMKHMSQDVDVSMLDEPFASVVKKAMAREPEARYQSCEEFVADMLRADNVRQSVSAFSPTSLTVVARQSAQNNAASDRPNNQRASALPKFQPTREGRANSRRREPNRSRTRPSKYFYLGQFVSRLGIVIPKPFRGSHIASCSVQERL
jgi:serine/threonine protein kinase